MTDFDLVARGLVTDTRAELEKAEATIVELRTWAEDLNELRNNLAQAAGTALSVLQDALKTRGPAADLEEQARDAEVELVAERTVHGTPQLLLAQEKAAHAETRKAWATAVVASMSAHPTEDWLPAVLPLLPPEIGALVQEQVAAQKQETDG